MASEIIVRINVESGKANQTFKKTKKGVDALSDSVDDLSLSSKKAGIESSKFTAAQKEAAIATELRSQKNKQATLEIKSLAAAELQATGGTKNFRTQVGLNNAILTEAGRAASDLRFGFNGVANNVGQLASLFGSLINTSDSVGTSLRNLANSLLGTGGIMIGIQLLIAYGDRIFAFFSSAEDSVGKFRKGIDDATESMRMQIETFKQLISSVTDYGDIGKFMEDADFLLSGSFPKYRQALEDIEEGASLVFKKDKSIFSEGEEGILKGAKALEKYRELFLDFLSKKEEEKRIIAELKGVNEDDQLVFTKGSEERARKEGELKDVLRERLVLQEELNLLQVEDEKGYKSKAKTRQRVEKLFKAGLLQLEKLEESYRRKSIDQDLLTEEEKIRLQEKFDNIALQLKVKLFKERQSLRLAEFNAQSNARIEAFKDKSKQEEEDAVKTVNKSKNIEVNKISIIKALRDNADKKRKESTNRELALQAKANETYLNSIIKSEDDAAKVKIQISAKTNTKLKQLERERTEAIMAEYDKQVDLLRTLNIAKEQLALLEEGDPLRLTFAREQLDLTIKQNEAELARIDNLRDINKEFIDSAEVKLADPETSDEQKAVLEVGLAEANTRAIELDNQYTKISIKNSKSRKKVAEAEQNAKIQGFTVVAAAMNAFAKLAGEDTKAGKALAVSGALISTYLSAQKAFESQFKPLSTVDSPVRGAIAAAAAVASGLANVKAIMSVNASGQTASAAPPMVNAPAFNVVGTSSADQLAQTVAATSDRTPVINLSVNEIDDKINENTASVEYSGF